MNDEPKKLAEMAKIEEILLDVGRVMTRAVVVDDNPNLIDVVVTIEPGRQARAHDLKSALLFLQSLHLRDIGGPNEGLGRNVDCFELDWSLQVLADEALVLIWSSHYVDHDDHRGWDRKQAAWNESHRRRWLGKEKAAEATDKPPMRSDVGIDDVDYYCPCGQSFVSRSSDPYDHIKVWINEHREHTNGKLIEEVTADGARVLASKPAPREIDLPTWEEDG